MKNFTIIGLITACLCTASCSIRPKAQDNGSEPKDSNLVLLFTKEAALVNNC